VTLSRNKQESEFARILKRGEGCPHLSLDLDIVSSPCSTQIKGNGARLIEHYSVGRQENSSDEK
jgi:hypothetical protein